MRSPTTVLIRSAGEISTEIGTDMSVFPSAGHLLSWARIVLRLDESAHRREDCEQYEVYPTCMPT